MSLGGQQLKATVLAIGLAVSLAGCHLRSHEYTDPEHQVTVTYPGRVSLLSDPALLEKTFDLATSERGEAPKLSFALQTDKLSSATCAVTPVPGKADFSAETYFQATTARELAVLEAEVLEPRSEVSINGKTFQQVGFVLTDGKVSSRSRIYEHYDPASRRVLVFSLTTKAEDWESESPVLEAIARSLRLDW